MKISVRDRKVNNGFGSVLMNLGHYNLTNQMNLFLEGNISGQHFSVALYNY